MDSRHRRVRSGREDIASYADRPPPTPSPSSTEFQEYHQRNLSVSGSSVSLAQLLNPHMLADTHDEIPTYDETINRDQEIRSARMSVSSSLQNGPTSTTTSSSPPEDENIQQKDRHSLHSLKTFGLNFLNAKQHLALASCRDLVLLPPLYHAFICLKNAYYYSQSSITQKMSHQAFVNNLILPGSSEYFISGIWCLVAAYLSFSVVDGLMIRWIVTYQTSAAIVRVLSMSMLLLTIEQVMLAIFSPDGSYSLHTWVLISCVLTGAFIIQNFVTSNLDLKNLKKQRFVDYYNITVYAVVPVGLASFVSMIALLRALMILRVDIERREYDFSDVLTINT